jgi:hypothetical protein
MISHLPGIYPHLIHNGYEEMTNLNLPSRLSTTTQLAGCQVLPEKGVIDVTTPMEIDQRLQRNLSLDILILLSGGELLRCGVEAVDVGLVVVLVVELHDLTGDGRLERAIVI